MFLFSLFVPTTDNRPVTRGFVVKRKRKQISCGHLLACLLINFPTQGQWRQGAGQKKEGGSPVVGGSGAKEVRSGGAKKWGVFSMFSDFPRRETPQNTIKLIERKWCCISVSCFVKFSGIWAFTKSLCVCF
jgi:hypothetical protein